MRKREPNRESGRAKKRATKDGASHGGNPEGATTTRPAAEVGVAAGVKIGASLGTDALIELYRTMLVIRRCEERLVKSYQAGLVFGACHTYIGEEATAAGVCAHLSNDDLVFSTHRGHGHALAKGVPPYEVVAELYGKATGCSGGRGGSMHLFKPEVGLMGTSGIVGPSILLAAGAAYSFALRKTGRVSVAFFGDGATGNGAFHEGLNLASVWSLPVVFVCENNLYATEVPLAKAAGNTDIASRAATYGMPGEAVDGNDVTAVYAVAEKAVGRARAGGGPTLIEARTYRTRPHAEGMRDAGYRTKEEIEEWKERCPIRRCRRALTDLGFPESELQRIDAEVVSTINEAHTKAADDPWPDPASAADGLYTGTPLGPEHLWRSAAASRAGSNP
jgi:2-oxoisovalerate dehydrogenase E1 component